MKNYSKSFLRITLIILITVMNTSCVSIDDTEYENGYYITELNYNFDKVYQMTINSIKTGITYNENGHPYHLVENSQTNDKATIVAIDNNDPSDRLKIIIYRISKNVTKIMIKYDSNGDSIRSSALLNTLKEGLAV
ncbi:MULTISPECIES: DUF3568 family protein [Francisella]|uniref:DUF3568 family protein n=1 Tax=Francisella marina TaxID=2249302 RepID=A0ABX5ZI61_9GAMM|nr:MULTISPECIES: DUF3568 family protein [Francisella]QEO57895.1 DUF3568 family protein [Francisella marina]QEO59877.1 DUF3568 family protein [Francisella marina]